MIGFRDVRDGPLDEYAHWASYRSASWTVMPFAYGRDGSHQYPVHAQIRRAFLAGFPYTRRSQRLPETCHGSAVGHLDQDNHGHDRSISNYQRIKQAAIQHHSRSGIDSKQQLAHCRIGCARGHLTKLAAVVCSLMKVDPSPCTNVNSVPSFL